MELEGDEVEKSLRSERLDDSADAEQSLPSSLDLFSKTPKKSKTKKAAEVDPKRINVSFNYVMSRFHNVINLYQNYQLGWNFFYFKNIIKSFPFIMFELLEKY